MIAPAEFDRALEAMPIIAILRGIHEHEAVAIVEALYNAGVRIAEVPLNSPEPFETIATLRRHFDERMIIGAGTVVDPAQIDRLVECGAQISVAPNTNGHVIARAIEVGIIPIPGFSTASEAFAAIEAGARRLKLYPAGEQLSTVAALRAVLPAEIKLIAVGGIGLANVAEALARGCDAVGIGGELYRPGMSAEEVGGVAGRLLALLERQPAEAKVVCKAETMIGESPLVRRSRADRLDWVDPVRSLLLTWSFDRELLSWVPLERPIWSIAERGDESLIGASDTALCSIDESSGAVVPFAECDLGQGCRLNDMTMDAHDGLWVGSMHRGLLAGRGELYHLAAGSTSPRRVASGLGVTNGLAYESDAGFLYAVDTLARTLLAYPTAAGSGDLGEPVIVTDFLSVPGKPDGIALASNGTIWVAMWGGGCVAQISPDGALLQTVQVAAPHVSSVAVRAHENERLYITTSRARLSDIMLDRYRNSGALFALDC